jgi:hypothetical protein
MPVSEPARALTCKRPYAAPRLTAHGTIAELTASKMTGHLLTPGYLTAA